MTDAEATTADHEAGADTPAPSEAGLSVADGVEHSLDPLIIAVERVVGWIVTATLSASLLVAVILAFFLAPLPGWLSVLLFPLWGAATLAIGWFTYRWPEIEHRHTFYTVDERGIEIRRGVYWRTVINVPRSRVQHTDVSQGPLERRHGLGTLVVYTAGTDYARVDLHGLNHSTALRIRDHLLPRESSDAV